MWAFNRFIQKEIHTGIFVVMDATIAGDGPGPRCHIPQVKLRRYWRQWIVERIIAWHGNYRTLLPPRMRSFVMYRAFVQ